MLLDASLHVPPSGSSFGGHSRLEVLSDLGNDGSGINVLPSDSLEDNGFVLDCEGCMSMCIYKQLDIHKSIYTYLYIYLYLFIYIYSFMIAMSGYESLL